MKLTGAKNNRRAGVTLRLKRRIAARQFFLFVSAALIALSAYSGIVPSDTTSAAARDFTQWTASTGKDKGFVGDRALVDRIKSSSDGTRILVSRQNSGGSTMDDYLYLSKDSGATWEPQTDLGLGVWGGFDMSDDGMFMAVSAQGGTFFTTSDGGDNWTSHAPVGGVVPYGALSVSTNGSRIAIGCNGYTCTSSDYGQTWTQRIHTSRSWTHINISDNGLNLVADTGWNGYMFNSTDGGTTWTQRTMSSNRWTGITATADGSKLAASTTTASYIYTSADYGTTWTQRTASGYGYWLGIASSANGQQIIGADSATGSLRRSLDSGVTWQAMTVDGSDYYSWVSVAMSADGTKIIAGKRGGSLYTSSDSGATWVERTITGSRNWQSVVASSDGMSLAAVHPYTSGNNQAAGSVYTSHDGGATWTERVSAGAHYWYTVAISGDGHTILAGADGEGLWRSTDGGATWTLMPIGDDLEEGYSMWYNLAISGDGSTMVAHDPYGENPGVYVSTDGGETWSMPSLFDGMEMTTSNPQGAAISLDGQTIAIADYTGPDYDGGYLYISHDAGATWQTMTDLGLGNWVGVTVSSDGSRIAVGDDYDGYLYISDDGGDTFTQRSQDDNGWTAFDASDDGRVIAALNYDNTLFTSTDYGVTWVENTSFPLADRWQALSLSGDGSRLVVAQQTGLIYTAVATPRTLTFNPSGDDPEEFTEPASTSSSTPQVITNSRPTFSGMAYANSPVTVTVHSDPIVCTTTADATGHWSCTLPSDVPDGIHTVTVELTDAATGLVDTLGPYYIQISAGQAAVINNDSAQGSPSAPNTGTFGAAIRSSAVASYLASVAVSLLVMAMAVLVALGVRKVLKKN